MSKLTEERQKTHGDYKKRSVVAQELKGVVIESTNYALLPYEMRDALDMICVKISRICEGNYDVADHWKDIAGYCECVLDCMEDV